MEEDGLLRGVRPVPARKMGGLLDAGGERERRGPRLGVKRHGWDFLRKVEEDAGTARNSFSPPPLPPCAQLARCHACSLLPDREEARH